MLELVCRETKTLGTAELVEQRLRVVGAVVVADAGCVTSDDEVRATVVAANLPVVDGFARSRVAHRTREDPKHHTIRRVVPVEQYPVALHADLEGNVIALGHAGERMQQQAVDLLERDFGQVLVCAMHGVARLKAHHGRPSALIEHCARLGGCRGNVTLGLRGDAHRPGDNRRSLREQRGDTGMRLVRGSVHLACLGFEVAIEDFRHCQRAEQMTAVVAKRDDGTFLQRARRAHRPAA